jgi:cytochrome P450
MAPDEFRFERPSSSQHLAFGFGTHYCVGASLARLEATIAFREIARRLPSLRPKSDVSPAYSSGYMLRALRSLPLEF